MLTQYLPILLFIAFAFVLGVALFVGGRMLGANKPDVEKDSPYECGFAPFEDARLPFNVKFYLVAILFIIFDLETAFLFPWAVHFRALGWFGLGSMGVFLGLLIIGFIYEWKKGALEWE